jgi:hypothetical protein
MIINVQDNGTYNIMLDVKSHRSTSSSYKHSEGNFRGGVEIRKEQANRSYQLAARNLDLTQNRNLPGTMGTAEEILNRYGDRGSGYTGLIIGKNGILLSEFLRIRIRKSVLQLLQHRSSLNTGDFQTRDQLPLGTDSSQGVYWLTIFTSWYWGSTM